jgi:hypothetical protein
MNWISIKDRTPEELGVYLVVNTAIPAYIFKATWYLDGFKADTCCIKMPYYHAVVTHWMPLPEAPEKKDKE